MRGSFAAGRLMGIPLQINYSWFAVFALVSAGLAMVYFPGRAPELSPAAGWSFGILASSLLFGSVVFHELGHSLAARHYGLKAEGIELFIMGGLSRMEGEVADATAEFWMAMAGPLCSFGLALAFYTLAWLIETQGHYQAVAVALEYLFLANFLLGAFNLLPGSPMDGGRVLKGVVWGLTGNRNLAALLSVRIGIGLALLIMLAGLAMLLAGAWAGIWLLAMGWFLERAADAANTQ